VRRATNRPSKSDESGDSGVWRNKLRQLKRRVQAAHSSSSAGVARGRSRSYRGLARLVHQSLPLFENSALVKVINLTEGKYAISTPRSYTTLASHSPSSVHTSVRRSTVALCMDLVRDPAPALPLVLWPSACPPTTPWSPASVRRSYPFQEARQSSCPPSIESRHPVRSSTPVVSIAWTAAVLAASQTRKRMNHQRSPSRFSRRCRAMRSSPHERLGSITYTHVSGIFFSSQYSQHVHLASRHHRALTYVCRPGHVRPYTHAVHTKPTYAVHIVLTALREPRRRRTVREGRTMLSSERLAWTSIVHLCGAVFTLDNAALVRVAR
jgi:hypothetical protein